MSTNALALLFSAYRRQVLGLLLLRPDDKLHVREIARLTGVPAGSLHRELRALTDAGLLMREPRGNQVVYRANRACPIYPELAEIFRKTAGFADVLREALAPLRDRIVAAFVFGSFAQRAETVSSDIDVFVIGDVEFAEVVARFYPLKERLGRDINPVVMRKGEFVAQRDAGERFVTHVMNEPQLFLIGNINDLG